ncbi:hypothetical protein H2203_002352 [Taxawa tesnikishii (nom. ined.)]|nr:hypothetical protein H2203_002352 [Dothideales sp. JES 119]
MAIIRLPQATYRGGTDDDINYYHGIPYSQPFERFQSPKPVVRNGDPEHVIDATRWGPICPQNPSRFEPYLYGPWPSPPNGGHPDESECGVLSVYQPQLASTDKKLPVIVYMHGGAWQTGSSQINWYTGTALARDGECIVVNINYRLGILGFLYKEGKDLACGNQDHILALEWVRDNIRHFGGDPDNITAAGQSAGAYNTQLLLDIRPDLFRRAIIQSSPASMAFSAEDAKSVVATVRSALPAGKSLDTASVDELLVAQAAAGKAHVSNCFMPLAPDGIAPGGRSKARDSKDQKDVLITWMEHDGSAFAALSQGDQTIFSDDLSRKLTGELFREPSIQLADRLHQAGHNVVTLEHQWQPEDFDLGATHCVDLPLIFGDFNAWSNSPMHGKSSAEEWDSQGKKIREAWGRFAKNGTAPVGLKAEVTDWSSCDRDS